MSSARRRPKFPSPALPSFDEAAALVAASAAKILRARRGQCNAGIERVRLDQALGRVVALPLLADADQPAFARSTRDGFACRAEEASRYVPLAVAGSTRAGQSPSGPLPRGSAWEIMTGAPVPEGADAVVMLEHVEEVGIPSRSGADRAIRLLPSRTLERGDNIMARGAQARKGDKLLSAGVLIAPAQIALAGSCGATALDVFRKPRVAILSTGDELVPIGSTPGPSQIRNSSSAMLAAMVKDAGGDPWILPIARDTTKSLDAAIGRAATADLVLITGGVSAGQFDLVEPALLRAGARFHFTGVRIQPGKPLVFGEVPSSRTDSVQNQGSAKCYCFGLPGNPVSSAVTFLLFAAPVVAALAGRSEFGARFALARLSEAVKTKTGLTRFLPAVCTFAGPVPEVALVSWQGSGDLAAMARANCFLVVPEDADRLAAGSTVRILLP
ncbi:MAG TPA: gephyrin-like molybdotransferase Glp [Terracidiphilus sp.]|jgi:molybdopterin molybdotransferase